MCPILCAIFRNDYQVLVLIIKTIFSVSTPTISRHHEYIIVGVFGELMFLTTKMPAAFTPVILTPITGIWYPITIAENPNFVSFALNTNSAGDTTTNTVWNVID